MPISMHRKLYPEKKNMYVASGIMALTLAVSLITLVPPNSVFIEVPVLVLITGGVFLVTRGIFGNKKGGIILAAGILGIMIMGRENILDYLTGGLWIMILILISLFN
jgi:hypothetical protein